MDKTSSTCCAGRRDAGLKPLLLRTTLWSVPGAKAQSEPPPREGLLQSRKLSTIFVVLPRTLVRTSGGHNVYRAGVAKFADTAGSGPTLRESRPKMGISMRFPVCHFLQAWCTPNWQTQCPHVNVVHACYHKPLVLQKPKGLEHKGNKKKTFSKNPDPSYGNTRPSVHDTPMTSQEVLGFLFFTACQCLKNAKACVVVPCHYCSAASVQCQVYQTPRPKKLPLGAKIIQNLRLTLFKWKKTFANSTSKVPIFETWSCKCLFGWSSMGTEHIVMFSKDRGQT